MTARLGAVQHLSLPDADVAFAQSGTGDVDLVLVHGFQNDHSAWDPFVERLDPPRHRVTRPDLVGCGESSTAGEGTGSWTRCTIDAYARDLVALCDALELRAPVLVGHSLGGGTVLRAALAHPERFAGLVGVAPVSTTGLDFLPEGAARAMRDFRCQDALASLASPPTLLVCGDRDRHVPLRNHLATRRAIPPLRAPGLRRRGTRPLRGGPRRLRAGRAALRRRPAGAVVAGAGPS